MIATRRRQRGDRFGQLAKQPSGEKQPYRPRLSIARRQAGEAALRARARRGGLVAARDRDTKAGAGARGPVIEAALRSTTLDRDPKARAGRRVRSAKQPYGPRLAVVTRGRDRGEGSGQRSSPTGHGLAVVKRGRESARGSVANRGRDAKARARRGPGHSSRFSVATQRREGGERLGHDSRSRRKGESEARARRGGPAMACDRDAKGERDEGSEARGSAMALGRDAKASARRWVRPAKQPYGTWIAVVMRR